MISDTHWSRCLKYINKYFLLQGIFLTQGWNLGLLHWREILYHLSHRPPGESLISSWNTFFYLQNILLFLFILLFQLFHACKMLECSGLRPPASLLCLHSLPVWSGPATPLKTPATSEMTSPSPDLFSDWTPHSPSPLRVSTLSVCPASQSLFV